jgi:hypothetical protein
LVSLYFWFMMGKSSWVHYCTQGLFPLVADNVMCHRYCKNCLTPAIDEEEDHGRGPSISSYLSCFCWRWPWSGMYLNYVWCWFKTILFPLYLNLVCNNYVELWCMWTICELDVTCDLYVELCMILVCILVDSRSFVILDGLSGYMGSSMTVWPLQWLLLYLCFYKLDGSVTTSM